MFEVIQEGHLVKAPKRNREILTKRVCVCKDSVPAPWSNLSKTWPLGKRGIETHCEIQGDQNASDEGTDAKVRL